jgi:1-acyl-sn-glycerol-3-phosphate acyltransferase
MPVAKAEVSSYPLLHFGAKKTGIIYVDRATPESRKAARTAIQDGLKEGKSVLVYPEGTISNSPSELRPFKKGAFYAAHATGVPVIAVAVQYHSQYAFWQNDRGMLQQYFLQFASLYQKVDMYISSPFPTEQAEEVVSKSYTFIGQRLT